MALEENYYDYDGILISFTKEPPTVEGWYFTESGFVHIVRETYPSGKTELVVYIAESGRGNEEPESVDYYCKLGFHWLGPVPQPELPKED